MNTETSDSSDKIVSSAERTMAVLNSLRLGSLLLMTAGAFATLSLGTTALIVTGTIALIITAGVKIASIKKQKKLQRRFDKLSNETRLPEKRSHEIKVLLRQMVHGQQSYPETF